MEAVTVNKKREAQLKIFKARTQPEITYASEGVSIVRRRGVRKVDVVEPPVEWGDFVHFSHPKIKDVNLWNLFSEDYFEYCDFNVDPNEDMQGFLREIHDFLMFLDRSDASPNDFVFEFRRPERNIKTEPIITIVKGKEKLEHEKYPKTYQFGLKLRWVIKP